MKLETVSANYDRLAPYYDAVTDLLFHRLLGFGRYREAVLAAQPPDLVEERHFGGAGLLLHGTRPSGAAENGTR